MVTFDSTDLDNAASESGVVHESVANTDHNDASNLKQGYQIANPYLSADLVGYWPLHEDSGGTANDFSGNNNDGTSNGGVTQGATGLLGTTSYSFDGVDDYVLLSDDAALNFGTSSFSITGWFNADDVTSVQFLLKKGATSTNAGYSVNIEDSLLDFKLADGSNFLSAESPGSSISTGGWTHFAGVYENNSDDAHIYIDGTLEGSDSGTVGDTDNTNKPHIGINDDGSSNPYNGNIANVRAYDTALTASQVQYLYDVVATSGTLTTQYKTV